LQQFGWSEGSNVRINTRWGDNDVELDCRYPAELLALAPDVILARGTLVVAALRRVTRTSPIVFAGVSDPVGAGFVDTLARPGGNITGFMIFEYSLCGKWLELLKEIAPRLMRAPAGIVQFGAAQARGAVSRRGVAAGRYPRCRGDRACDRELRPCREWWPDRDTQRVRIRSSRSNCHACGSVKLPAVYSLRARVIGGGLISYGPDTDDQFRQAAGYVNRIFKGEKPSDLPVQAPTKYELVINMKTARALGLDLPAQLRARADEVID
jgi:putative tryptophan/tyrosine transport system substrate-binding protein